MSNMSWRNVVILAAANLARNLPEPEVGNLWFKDKFGQLRPTPAQLARLTHETIKLTDPINFVKARIGKGHWPREEAEALLSAFKGVRRQWRSGELEHQGAVELMRQLAVAAAAEYEFRCHDR